MSDLEPSSTPKGLRQQRRKARAAERHLVRTTRVRTIPVPIGNMADLFAEIHAHNPDFQFRITGADTMTAVVVRIPVVVQQLGSAVSLRFEPDGESHTTVTATVPDVDYLLGNGHLLGVQIVLTFIEEGVERWNAAST